MPLQLFKRPPKAVRGPTDPQHPKPATATATTTATPPDVKVNPPQLTANPGQGLQPAKKLPHPAATPQIQLQPQPVSAAPTPASGMKLFTRPPKKAAAQVVEPTPAPAPAQAPTLQPSNAAPPPPASGMNLFKRPAKKVAALPTPTPTLQTAQKLPATPQTQPDNWPKLQMFARPPPKVTKLLQESQEKAKQPEPTSKPAPQQDRSEDKGQSKMFAKPSKKVEVQTQTNVPKEKQPEAAALQDKGEDAVPKISAKPAKKGRARVLAKSNANQPAELRQGYPGGDAELKGFPRPKKIIAQAPPKGNADQPAEPRQGYPGGDAELKGFPRPKKGRAQVPPNVKEEQQLEPAPQQDKGGDVVPKMFKKPAKKASGVPNHLEAQQPKPVEDTMQPKMFSKPSKKVEIQAQPSFPEDQKLESAPRQKQGGDVAPKMLTKSQLKGLKKPEVQAQAQPAVAVAANPPVQVESPEPYPDSAPKPFKRPPRARKGALKPPSKSPETTQNPPKDDNAATSKSDAKHLSPPKDPKSAMTPKKAVPQLDDDRYSEMTFSPRPKTYARSNLSGGSSTGVEVVKLQPTEDAGKDAGPEVPGVLHHRPNIPEVDENRRLESPEIELQQELHLADDHSQDIVQPHVSRLEHVDSSQQSKGTEEVDLVQFQPVHDRSQKSDNHEKAAQPSDHDVQNFTNMRDESEEKEGIEAKAPASPKMFQSVQDYCEEDVRSDDSSDFEEFDRPQQSKDDDNAAQQSGHGLSDQRDEIKARSVSPEMLQLVHDHREEDLQSSMSSDLEQCESLPRTKSRSATEVEIDGVRFELVQSELEASSDSTPENEENAAGQQSSQDLQSFKDEKEDIEGKDEEKGDIKKRTASLDSGLGLVNSPSEEVGVDGFQFGFIPEQLESHSNDKMDYDESDSHQRDVQLLSHEKAEVKDKESPASPEMEKFQQSSGSAAKVDDVQSQPQQLLDDDDEIESHESFEQLSDRDLRRLSQGKDDIEEKDDIKASPTSPNTELQQEPHQDIQPAQNTHPKLHDPPSTSSDESHPPHRRTLLQTQQQNADTLYLLSQTTFLSSENEALKATVKRLQETLVAKDAQIVALEKGWDEWKVYVNGSMRMWQERCADALGWDECF
ncbi:hypothetical protein EDC01DRAFT_777948 [Geopyxis carbonaria]|nr:hypothetical protein EDC01DRAFT_777948 [Geopyxis carbonaria]